MRFERGYHQDRYKNHTEGMSEFFKRFIFGILNIDENSKKELEKLDTVEGFQVAAEVTLNLFSSEIKVESQCLEAVEKPAPAGTYFVPRCYKKKTISLPQKKH